MTFNCTAVQSRNWAWYTSLTMDKEEIKEWSEALLGAAVLGVGCYVLAVLMFCL